MNYETLSYEDIHRLAWEDEDEYKKIPVEIIRKIIAEEAIKRNTVHIDDSSICL